MTRRAEHIAELKDRLAYETLNRLTLGIAELMGYAPYDLKIVHDDLVENHGFIPLPHLSDEAYEAAMETRRTAG